VALVIVAVIMIFTGVSQRAGAQSAQPDTAWHHAAWLSGGVGVGNSYAIAANGSANYSTRSFVITARAAGTAKWVGAGVNDVALMAGVRTSGRHTFFTATAGLARATPVESCDACGDLRFPSQGALAYEAGAHANWTVIGVGATLSGVDGTGRAHYVAITVSFQAGDFGW